MSERVRSVKVTIVVDTNKRSYTEVMEPETDEPLHHFSLRVEHKIDEIIEGAER